MDITAGLHPLGFAIEAAAAGLVILWSAAVAFALLLTSIAGTAQGLTWQPVAAVLLIVIAAGIIVYLHRAAGAERDWVVDRLRHDLET